MRLLVGGTRRARYDLIDFDKIMWDNYGMRADGIKITEIVEGCAPNSADILAEKWAESVKIPIKHYPAKPGNYLKRNVEMVDYCDEILALWDGYSYGTCFVIGRAIMQGKPVRIIEVVKI